MQRRYEALASCEAPKTQLTSSSDVGLEPLRSTFTLPPLSRNFVSTEQSVYQRHGRPKPEGASRAKSTCLTSIVCRYVSMENNAPVPSIAYGLVWIVGQKEL